MARATTSAELYTSAADGYGRFEARLRFAGGDGVISSFFLWKDGSEQTGAFWNELDFEKLGADCHLQTNALYGKPVGDHSKKAALTADLCNAYHVYAYEWLPDSIAWFVDGTEIRRETGDVASAYAVNAPDGMQVHFNIWPGDASFGGTFSPSILPVHEYIDWVQFSPYVNGAFAAVKWREDFSDPAVPSSFLTGNWASAKNLSTHDPSNVNFIDGYAVLSLTADNAMGPAGAMPNGGVSAVGGSGGTTATSNGGASGTATSSAGAPTNTAGSSSATAPSSEPSLGCGCMQARSRRSMPAEFPVGALVLITLVGAVSRRRRVGLTH
ncbi:MAG: family 16 glycosylhydrolase [Polyangiaceae bacterium]